MIGPGPRGAISIVRSGCGVGSFVISDSDLGYIWVKCDWRVYVDWIWEGSLGLGCVGYAYAARFLISISRCSLSNLIFTYTTLAYAARLLISVSRCALSYLIFMYTTLAHAARLLISISRCALSNLHLTLRALLSYLRISALMSRVIIRYN